MVAYFYTREPNSNEPAFRAGGAGGTVQAGRVQGALSIIRERSDTLSHKCHNSFSLFSNSDSDSPVSFVITHYSCPVDSVAAKARMAPL
jgi:hypothetical protein